MLNINCALDAGAHFGEYGQWLRKIGYRNRIVSIEPVKASYQIFQKTPKQKNWKVYNLAMGRNNSTAEINVSNHSVLASFLTPTEYSAEQFGAQAKIARKELVNIVTLDSIFKEYLEVISDPRLHTDESLLNGLHH